jgi:hypothetical protein
MIHPVQYQTVAGAAQLFTSGAAPKSLYGAVINTSIVRPGTLIALVLASAKTNTTTITGKWQASDDNSTFYDVTPQNNAARVAQVTGTGSAVASTVAYEAPMAIQSFKYIRFAIVTGTGTADGTDDGGTISYRYLKD